MESGHDKLFKLPRILSNEKGTCLANPDRFLAAPVATRLANQAVRNGPQK